ncbi:kinase-like domain-containing protein [Rhizophagus clarus]|uniref:Kinase-like domain-containing protein n=1 Tax=Rhizophagus clarus TaxID=94130 RepID=A0A8H3KUP7_9GLOM|nr:kinase-like domain-containing protein [Rhizophagus clarus]
MNKFFSLKRKKAKQKTEFDNHNNCSYCNKPFIEKLWCKECDPRRIMEGWTSGNPDIDKFINDTIYNARQNIDDIFLEWVPYNRFIDITQIGIDNESWKKSESKSKKVALKRLKNSQDMSAEYLNGIKVHWNLYKLGRSQYIQLLDFYGMTKDPETEEFIMIVKFANKGNLRYFLDRNFKNLLWADKLSLLCDLLENIKNLHKLGFAHKDLHAGNILQNDYTTYVSDFDLSGPVNEQNSQHGEIYGVLPCIAPEVLLGKPYSLSADIYSVGIIMTELSSGKPPFHEREYDINLAVDICEGLRPKFEKGTPEIYCKLATRCLDADPDQRPTAEELYSVINFWYKSINDYYYKGYQEKEEFGYKGKEIKAIFKEADKEILNISTLGKDEVLSSAYITHLQVKYTSGLIDEYLESDRLITSYLKIINIYNYLFDVKKTKSH